MTTQDILQLRALGFLCDLLEALTLFTIIFILLYIPLVFLYYSVLYAKDHPDGFFLIFGSINSFFLLLLLMDYVIFAKHRWHQGSTMVKLGFYKPINPRAR